MSGRTRHLRDGEWITNRKTDRRNPRRDPRDKLRELVADKPDEGFPIRMAFRLPKSLEGFVAPGSHGFGLEVLPRGFVYINSRSAEQCFIAAGKFFATIARQRPAFIASCIIVNVRRPHETYARYLTVVRGSLVVCAGGLIEPKVYEAAA
jgi:hypothetical protein